VKTQEQGGIENEEEKINSVAEIKSDKKET
jgi:hypothetical protein